MALLLRLDNVNTFLNTTVIGLGSFVGLGLFYTLLEDDLRESHYKRIRNYKCIFNTDNIVNPLGIIGLLGGFYYGYNSIPINFLKR